MDRLAVLATALALTSAACQVRPTREAPSRAPTVADMAARAARPDPWAPVPELPSRAASLSDLAEGARPPDPLADPWAIPDDKLWPRTDATPEPSGAYEETGPVASIVGSPARAEPISLPTSSDVVASMHGGVLAVLALTDDGSAAVSADTSGGVRLWPRLDGTREPIVVRTQPPSLLALVREDDGFVIAAGDAAGQLELVHAAETGRAIRRLALDLQRPVIAVHAVPRGFVALRDDHAVVALDLDGKVRGVLVAEPGEHVASLAVRTGRVLAIVGTATDTRGRWITFDEAGLPRWGERTVALPVKPDIVTLSPGGTRIAGIAPSGRTVIVFDLARRRVLARPGHQEFADPSLRPGGFLRDDVAVATSSNGRTFWWGRGESSDDVFFARGPIAVGDDRIVSEQTGSLMIDDSDDDDPKYLGYRVGVPSDVLPYRDGFLATDGRGIVQLDAGLHTRKAFDLPDTDPSRSWYGVTILDRTHVAAYSYARGGTGLYSIDLLTSTATLIAPGGLLEYAPSTGLMVMQNGKEVLAAHYDAKTGTFGRPVKVPVDVRNNPRIKLFDPATARGYVMAIVSNKSDTQIRIRLVRRIDFGKEGDEAFEIPKERLVEVDLSFWRTSGETLTLIDHLLTVSPRAISPDRKYSVEVNDLRITLRDARGTSLWTVPADGATAARWTPDGGLVAFGGGLAALDLQTGAMTRRQCGWRFGLWDEVPAGLGAPTQCDAPEHF